MGKPGGFFKRLKAKQARAASRRRRGTKGASKQERKAKQAEKAEYYAAKRTAEQLAAISSSSDDDDDDYEGAGGVSNSNKSNRLSYKKRHRRDVDSEEEVEQLAQRRLQRLRAVLGVKTKSTLQRRHERTSKRKKLMHDRDSVIDGSDDDEDDDKEVEDKDEEESEHESDVDKEFMKSAKHHDDSSSSISNNDYDDENDDDFLIEDEDMEDRDTENDNEEEEEEDGEDDEDDEDDVLNPLLALEEDDNNTDDNFIVNDEEEEEEENEEEYEQENDDNDGEEEDPYYSENDNESKIDDSGDGNVAATAESVNGSKRIAFSLSSTSGNNAHSTRQDEASLLLPHFELGTSSLEVIVQNTPIHRDDVWLQKYHLDVYDRPGKANNSSEEENTDTSAPEHMSNVTVPTSVINKLKHSNDELLAEMKKEDALDENIASKHHNFVSQDGAQTQLEEAEKKLFTVHSLADLLEWQPENISILATKTAQQHFKHPPFDVKEAFTTK